MKIKTKNIFKKCYFDLTSHLYLSILLFIIVYLIHEGYSTVVPIGSCILIYSEACPRSEIQFYLFSRKNPNNSELVYFSDVYDNVTTSSFNSSLPNKIIIHGYNADMTLDVLENIKTEYLKEGDYNIWFVNWPDLCRGPCYVISVYNLDQVGKCVAQMIRRLKHYVGEEPEPDIHIIGFSLGAHVAAYTSKYLKPYKIPRITGLDPAMPMFSGRDRDSRLDMQDAKFVDVVHTSAFVQGVYSRSGHVDFYMNGGIEQPGCWNTSNPFDCNHRRAPIYFAESINSKMGFWGYPCSGIMSYILDMCPVKTPYKMMGEHCANSSRGFFITRTKREKPFAMGPISSKYNKIEQIKKPNTTINNNNTKEKKPYDKTTTSSTLKNEISSNKNSVLQLPQKIKTTNNAINDKTNNNNAINDKTNKENNDLNEDTTTPFEDEDEEEDDDDDFSTTDNVVTEDNLNDINESTDVYEIVTDTNTMIRNTSSEEEVKYRFIYKVPRKKNDTE